MEMFRPKATSDQLAEHLRREIHDGTLGGTLPGIQRLVKMLGVNSVAVAKAVRQLEHEGLVINRGSRKLRLIAPGNVARPGFLKIGMLYYDRANALRYDAVHLEKELGKAGHIVVTAPKSMVEMGMDAKRTARLVKSMDVDAWVVYAGSLEILQWFEQHDKPAFALHGRRNNVNLPGIGVLRLPVISDLVSRLVSMGHRRIVMLSREERRKPHLGLLERYFLGELESHGIKTGTYNIPDWSDSPAGLKKLMQTLFRYTPPTALLVDDASLFHAVQIHLARRGITAPDHISLFCNDYEQSFDWALPEIAHIRWDHLPSIRRILKWARAVADGKTDRRKSDIKATQHGAGTLGPPRECR